MRPFFTLLFSASLLLVFFCSPARSEFTGPVFARSFMTESATAEFPFKCPACTVLSRLTSALVRAHQLDTLLSSSFPSSDLNPARAKLLRYAEKFGRLCEQAPSAPAFRPINAHPVNQVAVSGNKASAALLPENIVGNQNPFVPTLMCTQAAIHLNGLLSSMGTSVALLSGALNVNSPASAQVYLDAPTMPLTPRMPFAPFMPTSPLVLARSTLQGHNFQAPPINTVADNTVRHLNDAVSQLRTPMNVCFEQINNPALIPVVRA
jgi:hypothetical protein